MRGGDKVESVEVAQDDIHLLRDALGDQGVLEPLPGEMSEPEVLENNADAQRVRAWLGDGSLVDLKTAVSLPAQEWGGRLLVDFVKWPGPAELEFDFMRAAWVDPDSVRAAAADENMPRGGRSLRPALYAHSTIRSFAENTAIRQSLDIEPGSLDERARYDAALRAIVPESNKPMRKAGAELLASQSTMSLVGVELVARLMPRLTADRAAGLFEWMAELPSLPGDWKADAIGDVSFLDRYAPQSWPRLVRTLFETSLEDHAMGLVRALSADDCQLKLCESSVELGDWLAGRVPLTDLRVLASSAMPLSDHIATRLSQHGDKDLRRGLAGSGRDLDPRVVERLSLDEVSLVREALAHSERDLDPRVVERLAGDEVSSVRWGLAGSGRDLALSIVERLSLDEDSSVRQALARSGRDLDPSIVDRLARDKVSWVHRALARSGRDLDPRIVDRLSLDEDIWVREALAGSGRDLDPRIVDRLAGDEDALVREALAGSERDLDPRVVERLSLDEDSSVRRGLAGSGRDLDPRVVDRLACDEDVWVRWGLAGSGRYLAPRIVDRLACDEDASVRCALAGPKRDLRTPDQARHWDLDTRAKHALRGAGPALLDVVERLERAARSDWHPELSFPARPKHWHALPEGPASLPFRTPKAFNDLTAFPFEFEGERFKVTLIENLAQLRHNRRIMGNCTEGLAPALAKGEKALVRLTSFDDRGSMINVELTDTDMGLKQEWRVGEVNSVGNGGVNHELTLAVVKWSKLALMRADLMAGRTVRQP